MPAGPTGEVPAIGEVNPVVVGEGSAQTTTGPALA